MKLVRPSKELSKSNNGELQKVKLAKKVGPKKEISGIKSAQKSFTPLPKVNPRTSSTDIVAPPNNTAENQTPSSSPPVTIENLPPKPNPSPLKKPEVPLKKPSFPKKVIKGIKKIDN
jgi:hypothetical protein